MEETVVCTKTQDEFTRLVNMHINCVMWLVRNHFRLLIPEADRDDYKQEILLSAWKAFPKYKHRPETDFGTWLIGVGKYAVLSYRRRERRLENNVTFMEESPDIEFESPDYFDSEEVKCLHNAISNLPTKYRTVVNLYLSLGQVRYVATELNETTAKVEHMYHRAKCFIRKNAGRYFENRQISLDKRMVGVRRLPDKQNSSCSMKVLQYTEAGELVRLWPSLQELYRNKFIFNFPKDKSEMKWCKGYVFSYSVRGLSEVVEFVKSRKKPHPNRKPVDQLTMYGDFIRRWDSATEAANAIGGKGGGVTAAITNRGRSKSYLGFKWRFSQPL